MPVNQPEASDRSADRRLVWIGALALMLGLSVTVYRIVTDYQTPGPFTPDRQGLCDFHNGIYYPARATMAGESPYSEAYAAKNPVARQIPFFSPVILWLHAPFAILPLRVAEVLHTVWQIAVLIGIAIVSCRAAGWGRRFDVVLLVSAAIVWTRAGHVTLFNGYFTFELVLATFLALRWADQKPWAAGWMLVIVSAKPTYILPLGFLMLARGNGRAIVIGAVFSVIAAAASLGWIAYHEGNGDLSTGFGLLADQVVQTQEVHRAMEDESPVHSWTRLDLFAIIAKWAGRDPGDLPHLFVMFAVLVMPMWVLWCRRQRSIDDGITGLTGGLVMTTMLVSLYHQSYDALLVVPPILGLIGGLAAGDKLKDQPTLGRPIRIALIVLMGWPLVNYLSTRMFLLRWDLSETTTKILASLNGISLAFALVVLTYVAYRETIRRR
ncbi:glycosyltransferase family 87 protein [Neorhodopirellula pilleata]|uniref:Polyprenol-phosphate-mannose-dependent alpha-(1-2)-phosphatidylinositol mannoside mannosyltransferase n=1 Tax=Neorhodopirellula pilleata TaxID=2714738 RepID=A0A5C6AFI9_9BACT|nr:glycosyltransferase family 87 protein [Neorhodopirellula pilleata]TWT98734.1 hypothetical protein Pla100_18990 [Neorhodopirellula pilleata]